MKTYILKILILGFIIFSSCKEKSIEDLAEEQRNIQLKMEQRIAQLKIEIEDFAKNKACSGGDNCRAVGIGNQPCGGPSGFIIYSLSTTDEKLLMVKVNEYTELQKTYNLKYDIVGVCLDFAIPTVDCKNGVCTK